MRKLILVCLVTLFIEGSAYGTLVFQLTDLGTVDNGPSSYGTAINDNGTAVGFSSLPGGEVHAFRWTPGGGIQDIGSNGTTSRAFDVNNSEHIVGQSGGKAFRWTSGGGLVAIDGANNGTARDLNENSEAVGERDLGASDRTIRWSFSNTPAVMFPLADTAGAAINDSNQFVGTLASGATGYYSDGTSLTLLSTFLPKDLNNNREIVGSVGGVAALLDFDSSTTTLLGKLSLTDASSQALGVNEGGTIVGMSGASGAFIYDSSMGGMMSLTSLLEPSYAGWTILAAEDINNMTQIVGVGRYNGVDHAVVLSVAVPEPSALRLGLLATAIALLGIRSSLAARWPRQTGAT